MAKTISGLPSEQAETAQFLVRIAPSVSSRRSNEIIAAPKSMASTPASSAPIAAGPRLRPDDLGQLWEHYVLNELTAQLQTAGLRYWRDKQGHEVDLIWAPRGKSPTAIECKWSARDFNPANLLGFARAYPKATLLVTTPDARPAFTRNYSGIEVQFLTLDRLAARIASK